MAFGLLLIALAAALFGTTGTTATYLHRFYGLDPMTVGVWRLLFGAPMLLLAAWWTTGRRGGELGRTLRRNVRLFVLFGAAVAGYQLSFFEAVIRSRISTATLLAICTGPVLVALLARLFLGERLTGRVLLALLLSIPGAALVVGLAEAGAALDPAYALGHGLALVAALSYSSYVVISKGLVGGLPPVAVMGLGFGIGAVLLLPFASWPQGLPLPGWALLLYLGFGPTALAYVLYSIGLRRATATAAAIGTLLEPLVATLLAVGLVGERLLPTHWAGAGLLLSALAVLALPARNRNGKQMAGESNCRTV
ncbi:MAG: EamA family transporter [Thermoanaerobacterales bacterium]|nr:EamA family transporter [Bacillota bacterium]MDI6907562.1 EamA family transporter [Thermoanaerobacterales bacterium]